MTSGATSTEFRRLHQIADSKGWKLEYQEAAHRSAVVIQSAWRGYRARVRSRSYREQKDRLFLLRSVVRIQKLVRGFLVRRRLRASKEKRKALEEEERVRQASEEAKRRREEEYRARKEASIRREQATLSIQRVFRGHRARKRVAVLRAEGLLAKKNRAAVFITALFRGIAARKEYSRRVARKRNDSATKIQKEFRSFLSRISIQRQNYLLSVETFADSLDPSRSCPRLVDIAAKRIERRQPIVATVDEIPTEDLLSIRSTSPSPTHQLSTNFRRSSFSSLNSSRSPQASHVSRRRKPSVQSAMEPYGRALPSNKKDRIRAIRAWDEFKDDSNGHSSQDRRSRSLSPSGSNRRRIQSVYDTRSSPKRDTRHHRSRSVELRSSRNGLENSHEHPFSSATRISSLSARDNRKPTNSSQVQMLSGEAVGEVDMVSNSLAEMEIRLYRKLYGKPHPLEASFKSPVLEKARSQPSVHSDPRSMRSSSNARRSLPFNSRDNEESLNSSSHGSRRRQSVNSSRGRSVPLERHHHASSSHQNSSSLNSRPRRNTDFGHTPPLHSMADMRKYIAFLKSENSKLLSDNEKLAEENRMYRQSKEATKEVDQIMSSIAVASSTKENEISGLRNKLAEIGSEMQKKKELEKQIETKDHALKKYQIEMSELEKQKNSLQGQVVALRSELRTFSVDIPDHVKDDIDNYKKKNQELELEIRNLQTQVRESEAVLREKNVLERRVREMKMELERAQGGSKGAQSMKEVQKLQVQLDVFRADLEESQSAVKSLQSELSDVQLQLNLSQAHLGEEQMKVENTKKVFGRIRENVQKLSQFIEKEANFGLDDDQLRKLDQQMIVQLERYETSLFDIVVEIEQEFMVFFPGDDMEDGSLSGGFFLTSVDSPVLRSSPTAASANSSISDIRVPKSSSVALRDGPRNAGSPESRVSIRTGMSSHADDVGFAMNGALFNVPREVRDELVKKNHELEQKRRELDEMESKLKQRAEKLNSQEEKMSEADALFEEKMMEIREIEAQKQLLAKIEESLEEKQRELNDRDAMFERAMEKQRMQFDEEKRELEKIGQEVAALLEQQKNLEVREEQLALRTQEIEMRSREIDAKELENASMMEKLVAMFDEQQGRDNRAQEELQRGYQILQTKFTELAQQEKSFREKEKDLERLKVEQQNNFAELSKMREEVLKQRSQAMDVQQRVETTFQMKRQELHSMEEMLNRKKRELQALSIREKAIHEMFQKLDNREKQFEMQERRMIETISQKKQESETLEESMNAKKRELQRLSQMLSEHARNKESLEKSEMNLKMQEYKLEERLQKKKQELEQLEDALRQRRRELETLSLSRSGGGNAMTSSFEYAPSSSLPLSSPMGMGIGTMNMDSIGLPFRSTNGMNNSISSYPSVSMAMDGYGISHVPFSQAPSSSMYPPNQDFGFSSSFH